MITHPFNPNLHVTHESVWQSFPLLPQTHGLIEEYLLNIQAVMNTALANHPRTLMIRCDLRFPQDQPSYDSNAISRFMASLKAQIEHDQRSKYLAGQRVHDCQLRYIWAKEQATSELPHYHIALFLNRDSYFNLGQFQQIGYAPFPDTPMPYFVEQAPNMACRIVRAWASALGTHESLAMGLVHFPDNPTYYLRSDDPVVFAQAFQRLSYLAKADTKLYRDGTRWFGTSRS